MIKKLIEEYKNLTAICAHTDYSNKLSVKEHNIAAIKMHKIITSIENSKSNEAVKLFAGLLDIPLNKTNLWAAFHLLERLPIDKVIETEAIKIIEIAAKGKDSESLGCQMWLSEWKNKRKNTSFNLKDNFKQ